MLSSKEKPFPEIQQKQNTPYKVIQTFKLR